MKGFKKKLLGALMAFVVTATSVLWGPNLDTIASASELVTAGVAYKIVNASTGKCIDVPNGNDENFQALHTWEDNGANAEQFTFVATTNGYYNIIPVCAPTRAVDNPSGSTTSGTVYQLYSQNGLSPQEFSLISTSDGYVKLINRRSNMALTDSSGDLVQLEETDDYNQKWLLIKADNSDEMFNNEKLKGQGNTIYTASFNADNSSLVYYSGLTACEPRYINNTLTFWSGNSNKVIVSGQNFTNFVAEADVKINQNTEQSSNQGGILFRASNGQSGLSDGYDGYYFGLDAANNQAILGKVSGNTWTRIAYKQMYVRYGKYYHLQVAVSGNEITCYVNYDGDNYAKLVAIDSDFSSGSVGLRHWNSGASFKNLKVSSYIKPSAEGSTYTNSVLGSCADPDVLYYNGVYYLYSTNTTNANNGFKVYASTDLTNWTDMGWALTKGDVYGTGNFWAPDLIEKDGTFYMYYVADEHLSVATADNPLGPFTQTESQRVPMHTDTKEIDAHVFQDDDGQYYIYFVRFYGDSGAGNYIYGAKLNSDMRTMDDSTITCILSPTVAWERDMAAVNEGPFMLKKDGVYYLTYSGSHFQSEYYGSGYATGTSPLGTFTKYENNPIMQSNTLVHGAGHHCIVESPDGSEMFIVYHCHSSLTATEPRKLCIDRLHYTTDEDGNRVLEVEGPTLTEQAVPSGVKYTYPEQLLQNISLEGLESVNENIKLPGKVDGVEITWSSSDNSLIDIQNNSNGAVGLVTRDDEDHTVKLTASISIDGTVYSRQFEAMVRADIPGGIELKGYQISVNSKGLRTVYSVESEINGKAVVESGMVYSLVDYTGDNELYVGSGNSYVHSFASTEAGKFQNGIAGSSVSTYAMTMKFYNLSEKEINTQMRVRAYAKLSDGTYVYTDSSVYSVYSVADYLYSNKLMTGVAYNYLYDAILSVGNKDYVKD